MADGNELNSKRDESELPFRYLIALAWGISGLALGFIVLLIVSNGISDFLRAPIGIKDNPPDPELLIQYARLALNPVALAFALLWALKTAAARYSTKLVLLGLASVGACAALVISLIGVIIHRELIPGSFYFWGRLGLPGLLYFWDRIAPLLFALVLLLIDLAFAYGCASDWRQLQSFREKLGTILLASSAFPPTPNMSEPVWRWLPWGRATAMG